MACSAPLCIYVNHELEESYCFTTNSTFNRIIGIQNRSFNFSTLQRIGDVRSRRKLICFSSVHEIGDDDRKKKKKKSAKFLSAFEQFRIINLCLIESRFALHVSRYTVPLLTYQPALGILFIVKCLFTRGYDEPDISHNQENSRNFDYKTDNAFREKC